MLQHSLPGPNFSLIAVDSNFRPDPQHRDVNH